MATQVAKPPFDAASVTVTDAEYARAVEAGRGEPHAKSVHFDRESKRLHIELQEGREGLAILIPAAWIEGLEAASAHDIEAVKLLGGGHALHWPSLDVDVTVPGLVSGVFGTQRWMQQLASGFLSQAGRKGGSTSTPAKRASSRANGKLGGRPRKKTTA